MEKSDNVDIAIVGAGIFGLSCAFACAKRGKSCVVLEKDRIGAGASGGLVGALSPHLPNDWNAKKQFQLDALVMGAAFWADVEDISGLATGYGRTGRWLPIVNERMHERYDGLTDAAGVHWPAAFDWQLVEAAAIPAALRPLDQGYGVVFETLSARIHPQMALRALARAVTRMGVEIRESCAVTTLEGRDLILCNGKLRSGVVVLAHGRGAEGFGLHAMGRGVKGQAASLTAPRDAPQQMIFADGLYVIPHADGSIAIGSTSETDWDRPDTNDDRLTDVITQARAFLPCLAQAEIRARWAQVRPRGPWPDPIIGSLPGHSGVFCANGGFKIGFGIAPMVGEVIARMIDGETVSLPARFAPVPT